MRPEFLEQVHGRRQAGDPFVIATVVRVEGSASARCGARALFDHEGRNVFGWIGGGCAERFVGEQSQEALKERRTRVVLADLDDEIFGLGIACGGRMEVFIEPVFPDETLVLPRLGDFEPAAEFLARSHGFRWQWHATARRRPAGTADLLAVFADAVAQARNRSGASLRTRKDLPLAFRPPTAFTPKELLLVGRGRIVEALARWGVQLGWNVRVFGPSVEAKDYPGQVRCECLNESYEELHFTKGSAVVVASHHAGDPGFVADALKAGAAYVGMVGSRKRALEVIDHLGWRERQDVIEPLFVPAGLDLDARTPEEIALSIVAEIVALSEKAHDA